MNDVKNKPKKRHAWELRPGTEHLRWCPRCGIYEDTMTLRREFLRSVEYVNRTVYRTKTLPKQFFTKQPACTPPPEGTTVTPPPKWRRDALTSAITKLVGQKGAAP